MLIGVDFDNTIVRYDALFHALAVERALTPPDLPVSKGAVRDYLRRVDQEDAWTELQGIAYGQRMREAQPFPGVEAFFARCRALQVPVCIVSHRTRQPYLGEPYDLHQSARDWLEVWGFHQLDRIGLPRERVFFELTKEEKAARIAALGCTHFVDDLPEFLDLPAFPAGIEKFLFDPTSQHSDYVGGRRAVAWADLERMLLPQEK